MQETMNEMAMTDTTFKASDIAMSYEMAATWPLFVLLALLIVAAALVLVVPRRTFVRIFSATTATSGTLLVVLFFLPWLGAQCSGTELGTATGYELAAGERSLPDEITVQFRQTMDASGKWQEPEAGAESPVLAVKAEGTGTVLDVNAKDDMDAKPWVYAGLALAAGLGLLGVTTLLRPSTRGATGALICVLGLAGCVLMGYVACIQSFDGWIKPKSPEPPEVMMQNLSVRPKWPLFASLALYVLAIGCGVLMRFKGPGMRASPAPAVSAPPAAAPTPPQPTEPITPDHQ